MIIPNPACSVCMNMGCWSSCAVCVIHNPECSVCIYEYCECLDVEGVLFVGALGYWSSSCRIECNVCINMGCWSRLCVVGAVA